MTYTNLEKSADFKTLLGKLTRTQLRDLARAVGCPRGRNKEDTICNLHTAPFNRRVLISVDFIGLPK